MSEHGFSQQGPGEEGVEPDGVNSVALLASGFVTVVLIVCTILVAVALYNEQQEKLTEERVYAPRYAESDQAITQQQGLLMGYAAPSKDGEGYRIPIDSAKELVLKDLQN